MNDKDALKILIQKYTHWTIMRTDDDRISISIESEDDFPIEMYFGIGKTIGEAFQNAIGKEICMNEKSGRDKYWSELDSDSRIERLRHEVKRLQFAQQRLTEITQLLRRHQHNQNGAVVVDLPDYYYNKASESELSRGDDVYI